LRGIAEYVGNLHRPICDGRLGFRGFLDQDL
jgi:hypothetical protein